MLLVLYGNQNDRSQKSISSCELIKEFPCGKKIPTDF